MSYSDPMVEGEDPPAAIDELFNDCGLDVEDYMTLVLAGNAYSDNAELDAYYDACAAGDGQACDDLYFNSEIGTDYEAFGASCGDRFPNQDDAAPASTSSCRRRDVSLAPRSEFCGAKGNRTLDLFHAMQDLNVHRRSPTFAEMRSTWSYSDSPFAVVQKCTLP